MFCELTCRDGDGLEAGAEDGLEGGKLRISGGEWGASGVIWASAGNGRQEGE